MPPIELPDTLAPLGPRTMTRSLVDATVVLAIVLLVWFPFRRRISVRWRMDCSSWY